MRFRIQDTLIHLGLYGYNIKIIKETRVYDIKKIKTFYLIFVQVSKLIWPQRMMHIITRTTPLLIRFAV